MAVLVVFCNFLADLAVLQQHFSDSVFSRLEQTEHGGSPCLLWISCQQVWVPDHLEEVAMQDEECHKRVVRGATCRYVDVWSDDGFADDMNVDCAWISCRWMII